LFAPAGTVSPPVATLPSRKPAVKAKKLPAGFSAEENGEYFTVRYHDEWIGSIFHLGGKIWNLYFPNERGVCGFGGPDLKGAVAELHQCCIRKARGLEV
jgi:hypothetical protein